MAWKTTKRTLARRSLDLFSDTADLFLPEGSEFATVEDTSDAKYKKAITADGLVVYVLSANLAQV